MTVRAPSDQLLAAADAPPPPALERLRAAFDLSAFECRLAMLAFAYETEPDVVQAVAALTGDARPAGLPVWLVHAVLGAADWQATAAAASLRRWRILRTDGPAPRALLRLRLAEAVTDAMTGSFALDDALDGIFIALAPHGASAAGGDAQLAAQLVATLGHAAADGRAPVLIAPRALGEDRVAAALGALGLRPYRIATARLAARQDETNGIVRLFERDSAMRPAALLADVPADLPQQEALSALLDELAGHAVLLGDAAPAGLRRPVHRLEVRGMGDGDAASLWQQGLGSRAALRLNGSVERAAAHFALDAATIARTSAAVREAVESAASAGEAATLFWRAAARAAWPEPGCLARVVEPRATFDDLVVSAELRDKLEAIVQQVHHAATVFGTWKFDRHGTRGRGAVALFSGPSGTGKTLAAEVVANALDLPLVIADFSQLQSKWIGETPKLAARLFDDLDRGGAVLLVDEAEGLVGQRGAVSDANDRSANAEIGYFLQRLEAFRGLAILTTNMKHAIDHAFLRRFRFMLDFQAPDFDERVALWRRAFPPAAPVDGLDPDALARFNLSGGAIRNIALNAAFLAAEDGCAIGRRHVARALRSEYRKLERPLSELDVGGYA
jgi:AAA+ superfamily predicted ATPase